MFIWLIAFGVAVLGGIPYLIWMIVTAVKKRWRKLIILVAVPVVAYGILAITTGFIDRAAYRSYLSDIYGTSVDYGDPIFEYHSDRSFHGDGYSIEIYKLPDSIRKRFEAADADLLEHFPKRPSYRDDWETETWREAPFDRAFNDYLSFALSSYDADNANGLSGHFEDIRSALQSKRTFYSFFKYDHGDHPGNIDMFIIDLERDRVYEINHNT